MPALKPLKTLRAAACHVAPVFLDATKTTEKCVSLIKESGRNGANLVVFPESYIAAFPIWSALRSPAENHDLFKRMAQESVFADSNKIAHVRRAAKEAGVMVSLGFSESARYSSATLWNSNVFIDENGKVLNHHRKLVPTFFEKLTWSPGDGCGLRVVPSNYGKIGNLICGENTNPLARYTLMAQGEQVHISSWPPVWPTRFLGAQSNLDEEASRLEDSQSKNYDNVYANLVRAAAHCFEAKCFGILCSGFLDQAAIDIIAEGASNEESVRKTLASSQKGASMFLDPNGRPIPGFTITEGIRKDAEMLQNEEGVLYADFHVEDGIEGKQYHDVVGGYQRFDVFDLHVNRRRQKPIDFSRACDEDPAQDDQLESGTSFRSTKRRAKVMISKVVTRT